MYLCFQRDWDSRKKLVCHVLPLKYSKSVCERERERTATSLRENLISRGYVQFTNEAEKRECLHQRRLRGIHAIIVMPTCALAQLKTISLMRSATHTFLRSRLFKRYKIFLVTFKIGCDAKETPTLRTALSRFLPAKRKEMQNGQDKSKTYEGGANINRNFVTGHVHFNVDSISNAGS